MSGVRTFFDSNVLVYCFEEEAPHKQRKAKSLMAEAQEARRGVLSFQVMQEFINVVRKGQSPRLGVDVCERFVERLTREFEVVPQSTDLMLRGLRVHERFRISWYDSLIVAAAQAGGCGLLYSEDLAHGQDYGGVRVVNPFAG